MAKNDGGRSSVVRRLRPFVTTQEVAQLLHASVATIRRRAADGSLPSERTRGGHRRFRRDLIEALVTAERSSTPVARRADALLAMAGRLEMHSALVAARRTRRSWWEVFDETHPAVLELHARCASGRLSIAAWEVTLDRLRWALCCIAESILVPPHAPLALITNVPGDRVGVASAVFEVGLSEFGWRCRTPVHLSPDELAEELAAAPIRAAIISASGGTERASLSALAPRYLRVAREAGVALGVIGSGPWPIELAGLTTFPEVEDVHRWLERARRAAELPHAGAPVPIWSASLELGDPRLDAEHEALCRHFAAFIESPHSRAQARDVAAFLGFVRGLVQSHFETEERLMKTVAFPGAARHASEHERFGHGLAALAARLDAGALDGASAELARTLSEWWRAHEAGEDQTLARYLPSARPVRTRQA